MEDRESGGRVENADYLDALLDYQAIPRNNINLHLIEMFVAGSEKMSIAAEWAFAELMHRPHTFNKLREELDRVVGPTRRVDERGIPNLPYLNAVVKETYHPCPCCSRGYLAYTIPKGTQVSVNVWAIGRDPDRFLGSNLEYKGHDFNLIPFGSAQRMVPLAISTLVHSFDWELGN